MSDTTQLSLVYLTNLWLRDCHLRNLSINTIRKGYAYILCDFLRYLADDWEAAHIILSMDGRQRITEIESGCQTSIVELSPAILSEFIDHKSQSHIYEDNIHPWMDTREQLLSPSTIHRYVRVLKTFFNWCVFEEWIAESPASKLRYPKLPNRGRRIDVFTEDEISVLLDVAKRMSYRNYAVVLFMLDTLMRRREVIELTLDDVNLGTGLITVRHAKGNKTRWLRAGQHCQRCLRHYVREHRKARDGTETLFVNRSGRPLSNNAIGSLFKRLSENTQMHVHAHKLRHTGATLMAMQGENAPRIADRLGHESLDLANWYIHLAGMQAAQDNASPMDKLLSTQ
jgi:site-specific recombinase XerD